MLSFSFTSVVIGSLIVSSQAVPTYTTFFNATDATPTAVAAATATFNATAANYTSVNLVNATTTVLIGCPVITATTGNETAIATAVGYITTEGDWNATSIAAAVATDLPEAFDVIASIFTTVAAAEPASATGLAVASGDVTVNATWATPTAVYAATTYACGSFATGVGYGNETATAAVVSATGVIVNATAVTEVISVPTAAFNATFA